VFIGLDSFEGLPEDWGSASMPKGSFDVGGSIPSVADERVQFIKGWFQNTSGQLLQSVRHRGPQPLVVHFDADLYSSTLFALSQIATLGRPYYAIFDEFMGHETRALYNHVQAFNVDVQFLARTLWQGKYPQQVLCKISPAP
jgi:O-methyltransferase